MVPDEDVAGRDRKRTAPRYRRLGFLSAAVAAGSYASVRPLRTQAAQFEFKSASNTPVDHASNVRLKQMWDAVERDSGGRIHTLHFPAGQLGGELALLSQLRAGIIQALLLSPGILQSVVRVADVASVGFAFNDEDQALAAMDGSLGEYIRKDTLDKGIYPLRKAWNSGTRQLFSNPHPIRNADDLNALKLRIQESKITVEFFRALGASPAPISMQEVYTSLQTKLVDGLESPAAIIESGKFYEVLKYMNVTNHSWSGFWLIVNGDTWKSLPPDLQAVIERDNTQYALLERKDTKQLNASSAQKLATLGLSIEKVDVASFRARLKDYYARWAATFGSTAWSLLQASTGTKLG